MKVIVQVCVLLAIIAVAYSASSTWGVHNVTDRVILNKRVNYPAVRNVAQTFYFDIPESVSYIRNYLRPASGHLKCSIITIINQSFIFALKLAESEQQQSD